MSMLAERKQKQRWSLNPRGKHWSEDVNKFGHKMLEKMGWSAGKGLGANEDGITENIKVSYKNDAKGMGFKDNGEQWTKHEDNFTSLLANLGAGEEAKQITLPKPEKSLEKKSQSTKSRVHYHKFTRGKDLATRSEKDIANIFGRKTLDRPAEPKEETHVETETGTEDKSFGVVTVKAGNMADYFKSKLGKIGSFSSSKGDYDLNDRDDYESEIGACTGFGFASVNEKNEEKEAAASKGFIKMNFVSSQDDSNKTETKNKKRKREDTEDIPEVEVKTKKKKKNKKNQMAFDNLGSNINPAEEVCYDNPALNPTDSPQDNDEKGQKKKRVTFSSPITEVLNKSDESTKKEKSKKKKKNKPATNGIDNLGCEDNSFQESVQTSNEEKEKKTKKKKKRDVNNEISVDTTPTKKKKKSEQVGIDNLACEEITINEKNEEIKRYKMKKKAMEHGLVNPACVANDSIEEQKESPKKKKNKSKENGLNNSECEEHSILDESGVQKKKGKKQKNKNEESLGISNISDVSQSGDQIKSKKNKKNKTVTEEKTETSPKKLKKKSKSKESGIENLGCEINTVEENIASINSEIDNYQTELENEINVKKVKKQKKGKKENGPNATSEESQNQDSPNKKSKRKTVTSNEQSTNDESNFQENSESKEIPFSDRNSGNLTTKTNRRHSFDNINNSFNTQRGRNNLNRSFDGQRGSFGQRGRGRFGRGGPNHFNNRQFNDQGCPNNFNNGQFNDQGCPNNFNNGQFDDPRGPNNFNNSSFNDQRGSFGPRGRGNFGRGGPNNFNNSSFNDQSSPNNFNNRQFDDPRGPNNFNNRSFNDQRGSFTPRGRGNFDRGGPNSFNNGSFYNQRGSFYQRGSFNRGRGRGDRVDKSSLKHVLKPGELQLNFVGSNLMKLSGYGVNHELVGKTPRPEPKSETKPQTTSEITFKDSNMQSKVNTKIVFEDNPEPNPTPSTQTS